MSVGGIDLFHAMFRPLLFDSHRVPAGRRRGARAACWPRTADEIAAVVVEPLVQGAAGMLAPAHGYLRAVRELSTATTCC